MSRHGLFALWFSVVLLNAFPSSIAALADDTSAQNTQQLLDDSVYARRNGNTSDAINDLIQAQQLEPSSVIVETAIENLVGEGLPDTITADQLAALPVSTTVITGGIGTIVVPNAYIATPATEPQHGWDFGKSTYIYLPRTASGTGLELFCRLHYTSEDMADFARRTGSLLLLAHNTLVEETGHPPYNDGHPFDVWICASGQMGGEQWQDNIYFYDLSTQRSSIEWIREIVHEYSHLALPAIGGYSAPEFWANGYLGERLIVRWMARSPSDSRSVQQVWGDFGGEKNFDSLLIQPPLALYKKVGPKQSWLERTDSTGMDYFIGRMLALDDQYGSHFLGVVLSNFPHYREAKPTDLPEAIAEAELMTHPSHAGS